MTHVAKHTFALAIALLLTAVTFQETIRVPALAGSPAAVELA